MQEKTPAQSMYELYPSHWLRNTLIGLVITVLNKSIYDRLIPMGNKAALYEIGGLFLAVLAANVLFSIVQKLVQFRLTSRMGFSLQAAIYDRLFHVPESYVSAKECGVLAYQASSLSSSYVSVFQQSLTILMQGICALFFMHRMLRLSPKLFGMGFGLVAAEILAIVILSFVMRRYSSARAKQAGKLQSFLYQVFLPQILPHRAFLPQTLLYQNSLQGFSHFHPQTHPVHWDQRCAGLA